MAINDWPPVWGPKTIRYLQLGGEDEAERRAHQLWQKALTLCWPLAWQRLVSMQEFLDIFHPHAGQSQALKRLLKESDQVALLAVSLGAKPEERSRELLGEDEIFDGFMIDRMGSYLVEWCMSGLDRELTREMTAQGLSTTHRYSPGYQDFPLEAQEVFVSLARKDIPCLTVRENFSLYPEKSVTALKGIGPILDRKP
ncbi:MAG: hypothetical protein V1793_13375 [Pseudomonadota bacterium]